MRKYLLSVFMVGMFSCNVYAEQPKLTLVPAQVGEIAEVTADRIVKWEVRGAKSKQSKDGRSVYFTVPNTTVIVMASENGEPSKFADIAVVTLTVGSGPNPGPNPDPNPDPPLPPKPEPKPVNSPVKFAVVVEESGQRTADVAKVLGDLVYWKSVEAKGVRFMFYDKDAQWPKQSGYLDAIQRSNLQLPALLLLSKDGDLVSIGQLPKTTKDVDAKLAEKGVK